MDVGTERIDLDPVAVSLRGATYDVASVMRALSHRRGLVALDSAGGSPRRFSVVGIDPIEEFGVDSPAPESLDALEHRLARLSIRPSPALDSCHFAGGFLGAIGYELGVRGEALELPEPVWPQPKVAGGIYTDWLQFEHGETGEVRAVTAFACDGVPGAKPAAARLESVVRDLRACASRPPAARVRGEPHRTVDSAEHERRIDAARDLIAQGEIYQANLAHRMTCEVEGSALDLFLRLREVNPAPYMGFLRFPMPDGAQGAIVSSSPELLLELTSGPDGARRVARTRPIKGTIGRGSSFQTDVMLREWLSSSEKDKAELAMIVDLERNDLGRIATPGGVRVGKFPTVESYASVHHLVCDVSADVRDDVSAFGVVGALFPGGSITGAPKLRAMEVIADLEGEGRGFFTGSLGFVDVRGHAALNILIRTFVHRTRTGHAAEVSFHVGGGITWRSDPRAEDDETLLKAEGLLRALRVTNPPD